MSLRVAPIPQAEIAAALDDVARLRIQVFRDWPYLYEGDLDYERRYLEPYARSVGAVIVGAWDGARLVGAATGAPLEDHAAEFAAPFAATGRVVEDYFYCAESVLLPEYRGRGAGKAFFRHREVQARALGRRKVAFCAVVRPADHPARPAGYAPLDRFWALLGYRPAEGLRARFSWRDLGDADATEKEMQFWERTLP